MFGRLAGLARLEVEIDARKVEEAVIYGSGLVPQQLHSHNMAIELNYPHSNVFNQALFNRQIAHDTADRVDLQMEFVRRDSGLGQHGQVVAVKGGRQRLGDPGV